MENGNSTVQLALEAQWRHQAMLLTNNRFFFLTLVFLNCVCCVVSVCLCLCYIPQKSKRRRQLQAKHQSGMSHIQLDMKQARKAKKKQKNKTVMIPKARTHYRFQGTRYFKTDRKLHIYIYIHRTLYCVLCMNIYIYI